MEATQSDFFKTSCPKCGVNIEVPNELYDQLATCPECATGFIARPPIPKASFASVPKYAAQGAARVQKIPWLSSLGKVLEIIGSLEIIFGILVCGSAVVSALTGAAISDLGSGIVVGIFLGIVGVLLTLVGFAIVQLGAWLGCRFVCSECKNDVKHAGVERCPVCDAGLIPLVVVKSMHLKR